MPKKEGLYLSVSLSFHLEVPIKYRFGLSELYRSFILNYLQEIGDFIQGSVYFTNIGLNYNDKNFPINSV